MKNYIRKFSTMLAAVIFVSVSVYVMAMSFGAIPKAFAEDTDASSATVNGEAGCASVKVDPAASLEDQQAVCGAAEAIASSSCAAGGYGVCSSPKFNDIAPESDHCVCVAQEEDTEVEP